MEFCCRLHVLNRNLLNCRLPKKLYGHSYQQHRFYTMNPGVSKVNSCRSWLTNHRRFNFTTRNVQTLKLLFTRFITCLQTKFLLLITCLQKYLYILHGLLNRPSQLIRQYFIQQLVQVSLFTNILPPPPRTVILVTVLLEITDIIVGLCDIAKC